MSSKLSHSLSEAALEAGDAAIDSGFTIAARLPILVKCLVAPSQEGLSEWHEASSEKVAAAWEGAWAAMTGWNDFVWRSLLSPVTPMGLLEEGMVLARAVVEPGHRRVRANANRLRDR